MKCFHTGHSLRGIEWSHMQKLDEFSLARARKICVSARMLGFSLKFPAD